MRPITLAGFDAKFAQDDDPWRTFDDADEALKRRAILHGIGPGPWGRALELAAGNGSNSAAIAPRALRLDATEATASGTALVAKAVRARGGRARAIRLTMPAKLPRTRYDVVVIAEMLYYLSPRALARTARDVAQALAPGGTLVLGAPSHRLPRFRAARRPHPAPLPRRHGRAMAGAAGAADGALGRPVVPAEVAERSLRRCRAIPYQPGISSTRAVLTAVTPFSRCRRLDSAWYTCNRARITEPSGRCAARLCAGRKVITSSK